MAEQPAQVGTLQRYIAQSEREVAELREKLTEAQSLLEAERQDRRKAIAAWNRAQDKRDTQLTEAQQQNEVLRAERDRLREELTRFLQWECGELAMSERLPKQSFTSGSPAKLGGAVSREELVAHGPVEYALNRVATALERGAVDD